MNDPIWLGNLIVPRWLPFAAVIVVPTIVWGLTNITLRIVRAVLKGDEA